MQKKYYWLKLKNDFFTQPKIKKLRRIAGGDTYTCIYLKLMLLVIQTDGIFEYEAIEPTVEEEISLKIDEDVENVSIALNYLFTQKLLTQISNNTYQIDEVQNLIGTETAAAERMRKMRSKKSNKQLNCNNVTDELQQVTNCYTEIERECERDDFIKKENLSFTKPSLKFTTKVKVR